MNSNHDEHASSDLTYLGDLLKQIQLEHPVNGGRVIPIKARADAVAPGTRRVVESPAESRPPLIAPRWCLALAFVVSLSLWAAIIWAIVR